MANSTISLLDKLKLVFDVLDFPQDKKENLYTELLNGTFTLAMAKTIKENPTLTEKLKTFDIQNLTTDKVNSLNALFDTSTEAGFTQELNKIFNNYVGEICTTVDEDKKQKIQTIWRSEK